MKNIKKISVITLGIFIFVTLTSYIGWLLGYEGFLLVGEFKYSFMFIAILEPVLFFVSLCLTLGIVLELYDFGLIKVSAMYMILYPIAETIFGPSLITSVLLPFMYVAAISFYNKSFCRGVARFLVTGIFQSLYQFLSVPARTGAFEFGYNIMPVYQELIISIDLVIFLLLMYIIGGEKHYGKIYGKLVLFPESFGFVEEDIQSDLKVKEELKNLSNWKRIKAVSFFVAFQLLQLSLVLLICKIGNVFAEGFIIALSFIVFGFVIKRRWHSSSIAVCTFLSMFVFYAGARIVPDIKYSQFIPVIIGLSIAYSMYRLDVHLSDYNETKEYLNKLNTFELGKYCSYEKMKEIALKKNLTPREIDLLKAKYCDALTWAAMEIRFSPQSQNTIRKYLKIAEEKFNA